MAKSGAIRGWAQLQAALAVASLGALSGCASYPVRLYVDSEALAEIERTRFDERPDSEAVTRRVGERLSFAAEVLPPTAADFHRIDRGQAERLSLWEAGAVDSTWTSDLKVGDLLLAKNGTGRSLGAKLSFAEFAFHDHAAILMRRGDRWNVVESYPSFRVFGFFPDFAARFRGKIVRTSLEDYLRRYEVLTVVRLADGRGEELAARAQAALTEGIRFDPYHDPSNDELSCTEFVLEMMNRAGASFEPAAIPVTRNASMRRLLNLVGYRLDGYVLPDRLGEAPGSTVIARFSRHTGVAEAKAYEVAHRLLLEWMDEDALAGDCLDVDGSHLVRADERTDLFLGLARSFAQAHPTATEDELRQGLGVILAEVFHALPDASEPVAQP